MTEDLRKEFEPRSTEELVSILRNRDHGEWRSDVFEIVATLLHERGVAPEDVRALGPEGVEVVESAPLVTIGKFFNLVEADESRMALEGADIPAWVTDAAGGRMFGVGIGVRLQVRIPDLDAAREVLSAGAASGEDLPPGLANPPCPACGSRIVVPESWVVDGAGTPARRDRKWFYVGANCREAWPA